MGTHENTVIAYGFILKQIQMKKFIINYYLIRNELNANENFKKWNNILNNYGPDEFLDVLKIISDKNNISQNDRNQKWIEYLNNDNKYYYNSKFDKIIEEDQKWWIKNSLNNIELLNILNNNDPENVR